MLLEICLDLNDSMYIICLQCIFFSLKRTLLLGKEEKVDGVIKNISKECKNHQILDEFYWFKKNYIWKYISDGWMYNNEWFYCYECILWCILYYHQENHLIIGWTPYVALGLVASPPFNKKCFTSSTLVETWVV